ncbi:MAG TPA: Gfo/Idh/MocA family oxidoreductase [Candidatus Binatia bacterium]|nr:Gfo/Idh/MocA family oxidoreductase [Candidatus Binatia bacterium]
MTRLRFGVVGCGAIVTLHQLPALRRSAEVEVVAVSDRDGAWAARVARRFGVPASFADHHALLGRVDAALVATPNTTHADIACELLERGVHVLCEKPLATMRADVERMYAAAERGGARLVAGHCLRFSPNLAMLARVVADGWLGDVERVSAAIGAPYDAGAQRTDFRRKRGLAGGGVLIDLGVHVIDLAVWCAGAAPEVTGFAAHAAPGWEVESDAEVTLALGARARAELAASFTQTLANAFTVRGREGWATASLYVPTQLTLFAERARVCGRAGMQELILPDVSMYDAQLAHFCRVVRDGEEPLVARREVLATIDTIERCYARAGA